MSKKSKKTAPVAEVFTESPLISIGDPALAEFLSLSGIYGGELSEHQSLGLTAVYRAQSLIAGTIAGLPLKVYEKSGSTRTEIDHFLSSTPAGPYDLSAFSWCETLLLQMLNHGEGYLKAVTNEGGELIGLWPVHPLAIGRVRWDGADKVFSVMTADGRQEDFITGEMTQILALSLDGLRGLSPLGLFRQSFQTSRAGEIAANRAFTSGALIAGLVTTEEDVDGEEAKVIKDSLKAKMQGAEHAGDIAFVNRSLKFTPWAMTNADAEFLASRAFQVEEVARIYGVPPHLLASTEKVTSWGSGIQEQDLALAKYTLMSWTGRIESALKTILPPGQFAEFSYKGLLAGTPTQEITLLLAQVTAGLLTVDEARAYLNLAPKPKEDIAVVTSPTGATMPLMKVSNAA